MGVLCRKTISTTDVLSVRLEEELRAKRIKVNIRGSAENQRKSLTKGRIASEQSPAVEGILPRWAAGGGTKGVELHGLAPDPVNDYEYLMQSREATFDQRIGGARH